MIWLILLGYVILGIYLARMRPVNDVERSMLDLDHSEMADRYAREFGGVIPRRMPFRLPLEYWLWVWARNLFVARLVGLAVGGVGLWITMAWGGPIAGLVVLSSPVLVGALVSASYVPYVATLWIGGLWALATGHPMLAWVCSGGLAFLRPTSWWQTAWLLVIGNPGNPDTVPHVVGFFLACGLVGHIWSMFPNVVRAQGWWRLLSRESCPVQGLPQDGWEYGAKILASRYEAWGVWLIVAGTLGHGNITLSLGSPGWIIMVTLVLFMLTHLPRMLIRPKWAVGYVSEWLLPVAVAIGLLLSR